MQGAFVSSRSADPLVAQYNRMATSAAKAGDMDAALGYLRRLKTDFGVCSTRLPLYLMKAGRRVEAVEEFAELIATAADRTRLDHFDNSWPDKKHQFFTACEMADVYDAMRVAFKRAKDLDAAAMYESQAKEWALRRDELGDELDRQREAGLIP